MEEQFELTMEAFTAPILRAAKKELIFLHYISELKDLNRQ
jgi:hypothetical protein